MMRSKNQKIVNIKFIPLKPYIFTWRTTSKMGTRRGGSDYYQLESWICGHREVLAWMDRNIRTKEIYTETMWAGRRLQYWPIE